VSSRIRQIVLSVSGVAVAILLWQLAVAASPQTLIPGPWRVAIGIAELARNGLLVRYVVASLFSVTWGYLLAIALAIPFGIALGLRRRAELAINPILQLMRPISALAWIPIAILWFGVGDVSAIFLIFLASFLPLTVAAMHAVHNVDEVHVRAASNFGLSRVQLLRTVIVPAILPQLLTGMRISLGIAWLVVVAAEMIAVNSGLGFLIIDARNAGNRYDLVLAGMVLIGVVGLLLDVLMRRIERLDAVRWGYATE
jgi:NitT/TauT family transport system permease protein